MSDPERFWLVLSVVSYALCLVASLFLTGRHVRGNAISDALLALALGLHCLSIVIRWQASGHGPYVSLFEVLSGNIWSLGLIYLVAVRLTPITRLSAPVVLGVIVAMALWMLATPAEYVREPEAFSTFIMWIHLVLGKLFLGCSLIAAGLAVVVLRHALPFPSSIPRAAADTKQVERVAYTYLGVGLLFETLMLAAGAVFAQHAWGRYWAWDPLETMAFLTWATAVFALHYRVVRRPTPIAASLLLITVFALAFVTLFGVPFVSNSAHGGTFFVAVGTL